MHPIHPPLAEPALKGQTPMLSAEFLSRLGHALRSPINSILGFTELLLSGKLGPPAAGHAEFLQDILASARELLRLVDDVAAMARLDAGRVTFERRRLDLGRLIADVEESFSELAARRKLQVVVEVDPRARHAEVDLTCFRHVLSSYLATALELTPEGGRLTIRLQPESETHLRLELEHGSQDFPPEGLSGLFTPFENVEGRRELLYRGGGLRLALVRQLVEAQGGSVGVHAEPGQRIVFHALLPQGPVHAPGGEEVHDGR